MSLHRPFIFITASALALSIAGSAAAQRSSGQQQFEQVLGALLGQANTLDAQWMRGARPLSSARAQFDARLTAEVRSGAVSSGSANRLRSDYESLVALEAQYGADGRFTAQERAELSQRYNDLTQNVSDGGPTDDADDDGATVAEGRIEFESRVAAALRARRITRTDATRLRSDYQSLIQTEAAYARDGINARERSDLDMRLDALDDRLGDGPGAARPALSARVRLSELQAAISSAERSGSVTRAEAAEIRVQHGDLVRLEAAYARSNPSADDTAYLARRVGELENRAGGMRR